MNARPLTDAQISQALRAHLPEAAAAGLRERVFDAAETTAQLRSFPSFLGALSNADPVGRRRSLLIAAALLVALAFASAAAVGALRLLQRDAVDELSLEPPADLPAFVISTYERLPQLPPVALTWHDNCAWPDCDSAKGRIYVDRSGAVRFDRFASADATEPAGYRILSPDHRISGMAPVESESVWVEQGHEAIGDAPRRFIRPILSSPGNRLPGCEMDRDPSEVGSATAATGWRYVGLEYVAGRPTHHVACDIDLWIDIQTRLILRTREPRSDEAGEPIPGQVSTTEVTEIAFGDQPAALFEPPEGVARISEDEYGTYICARDLPNELAPGISDCPTAEAEATPPPEPAPTPMPTERPNTNECPVPPANPSQPIGPVAWTRESLKEDWPAPVRPETDAGGSVQSMPRTYNDPQGDNGSTAHPCVDIRWVMADTGEVHLKLVSKPPPWSCPESRVCVGVDPTEQWIAYGVVTDEDRDGMPDWRYGIDNVPAGVAEAGHSPRRGWRTNLHTGQTEAGPDRGDPPWALNGGGFQAGLSIDSADSEADATFQFGGSTDTTQGMKGWGFELDMPFYTWASVIVNGRVVATDYAPDAGWLIAKPDAGQGGDVAMPDAPEGGDIAAPGALLDGTYVLDDPFPLRLSMTAAHGWAVVRERRFYHVGGLTRDEGEAGIRIVMVDNLDKEYCADRARAVDGSATVDDLVAFLAGLPPIDISVNRDVTLDGYRGKYLEFTRKAAEIDCGWGGWDGWPASSPSARTEVDRVWILDVDGAPLVIDAFSSPGASGTVKTELRQIVDSIQIEP